MKKNILFTYPSMLVGGSTTSLISLLNALDSEKYNIDLLLYKNEGPLLDQIPEHVNLLPQACINYSKFFKLIKLIFNGVLFKALYNSIKYKKKFSFLIQNLAYGRVSFSRVLEKKYDVAVGFLELWADVYMNLKVKAKKKITWIHTDYLKAGYIPKIDEKTFSNSDYLIHVDEASTNKLKEYFPALKDRCISIENILERKQLLKKANQEILKIDEQVIKSKKCIKLLTVCRLDIHVKGLDRALSAIKKLIEKNYNVSWFIIGNGSDYEELLKKIDENNLNDNVFLLGEKINPLPYFKFFDAFFLPSRFEGKPMSVTEALMLGLPVLVTRYGSAHLQVRDGIDGIICDNSEEGICEMLEHILSNSDIINKMKNSVITSNYDNSSELAKIENLFNE